MFENRTSRTRGERKFYARQTPRQDVSSFTSFSINASFQVALRDDTYGSSMQRYATDSWDNVHVNNAVC